MQWEDYERICLRLVLASGSVRQCALYGTRGQTQAGIDFYAFDGVGKYTTYQCKRIKRVTEGTIRSAVAKFLNGPWAERSDRFVFCCSHNLSDRKLQEQIVTSRHQLAERNIAFETMGREDILIALKDHPRLVFDFFGRNLAVDFCGTEATEGLGKRIETTALQKLRRDLKQLYSAVFQFDARDLASSSAPLDERFIDLDIVERDVQDVPSAWLPTRGQDAELDQRMAPVAVDRDSLTSPPAPLPPQSSPEFRRQSVLRWIGSSKAPNLILGDTGSGKSTLLRAIALDLLSDEPKLGAIAERFGDRIPVWVPFASLAKSAASDDLADQGLVELTKRWLSSLGRGHLQDLIDQALADERLLLLVDGLDEYSDLIAANAALRSLVVHVSDRPYALIATGRPQAIDALIVGGIGWRSGRIAPLSLAQQSDLVCRQCASVRADEFIARQMLDELDGRPELNDLAETPLFLSYLVDLWIVNRSLPATRPAVQEAVLWLLLKSHTEVRDRASQRVPELSREELNDGERVRVMSRLALDMQLVHAVSRSQAEVEKSFVSSMEELFDDAMSAPERRRISRLLRKELVDRQGVLLQVGSDDFGFFHRSMQEYLCARALLEAPTDQRIGVVRQNLRHESWQQTVRSMLVLSEREHAKELVDEVRAFADARPYLGSLEVLLAEAATSASNLDTADRIALLRRAASVVEERHWIPDRPRIVEAIVQALRSDTAEVARGVIRGWFPARAYWQRDAFRLIAQWEPDAAVANCLKRALLGRDAQGRFAAANSLTNAFNASLIDRSFLRELAARDVDATRRATSLLALERNAPEMAVDLLEAARTSSSLSLRLVAAEHRVRNGEHDEEARDVLLQVLAEEAPVEDGWAGFASDALIQGWKGDEALRDLLMGMPAANGAVHHGELSLSVINVLLASAFPGDPVVGEFLAAQFQEDHPFSTLFGRQVIWELFARNFRDDAALVAAADVWLPKSGRHAVIETSYAALIGRTPIAKQVLLDALTESWPHWAMNALLKGWGADDSEVHAAYLDLFAGPRKRASEIAHLIPELEQDRTLARRRLLEILHDHSSLHLDFVLQGLQEIGIEREDHEVIESVFALMSAPSWKRELAELAMVTMPWEPRSRDIALELLRDPEGNWAMAAYAFPKDLEIRSAVISRLTPLDAYGRGALIQSLLRPSAPEDDARGVCSDYVADEDLNVATVAAIGYFQIEARRSGLEGVRTTLTAEVGATGPTHDRHAQTAFAAALDLGIPEVIVDAKYAWNPERLVSVRVGNFGTPNVALVRGVLSRWKELHQLLGDQFSNRLSNYDGDMDSLWAELVVAVDEFPNLRSEALDYLVNRGPTPPPNHQSPEVLAFLARADPRGAVLRQFCVPLVTQSGRDLGSWQAEEYAAELLGSHFGGQDDVLREVRELVQPSPRRPWWAFSSAVICALAEGWPESDLLDIVWDYVREADEADIDYAEGARASLWATRGDTDQLMIWLDGRITEGRRVYPPSLRARHRALAARFRRDGGVREAAGSVVLDRSASPSRRISLFNLLLNSGAPISREIERLASDELAALSVSEVQQPLSDVGFDLISGQDVSLSMVLSRAADRLAEIA
jgi:energy-coupling factor transporter ATP-binding protein EcfA2